MRATDCLDAIQHLPDGASLVIHQFTWNEYERLLDEVRDRRHVRISYDRGRLEIMTPLPDHEGYEATHESRCLRGLTPSALAEAFEQSRSEGQTRAIAAFRDRWRRGG